MKNKKQKTPKLPKYELGNMHEDAHSNAQSGTQNIYNQGRESEINAGQYAQYGQAAMGLGTQLAANQSLTGEYKQEANNRAVSSTVDSTLSTATPWYGYAKAGSDMGRSMVQRDENGVPIGKMNKQLDAVMKPQHQMAIDDASKGNYGLAAAEMFLPGIGYESRSNSLGLGKGINRMFKSDNGSNYQYAMGGMNMQPNAEVEKQENTLNPDGSTNQYNGASHEQGGIPTNLDAGTLIFSDKLKIGGKTFAKLNKPNMTHKEDKILSDNKASAMSKLTANLMKQAKNKSSIELFEAQEALKQSKLDSYTKRLGGIMKYHNGGITPQQYKQAQSDSLTLYNSGLKSNIPNFEQNNNYTDAFLRLNDLNKKPPVPTNNVDPYSRTTTATYIKPTMLPYIEENFKKGSGIEKIENYAKPVGKPANHPNYNQFIPGINQSKQPIQTEEFKNGGRMLPKFWGGGVGGNGDLPGYMGLQRARVLNAEQNQRNLAFNQMTGNTNQQSSWLTPEAIQASSDAMVEDSYPNTQSNTPVNQPNAYPIRKDKNGKLIFDNPNAYKAQQPFDFEAADARQQAEIDAVDNRKVTDPNDKKFDWKGLGTQAAYFAANNAGNIYDLARANKTETRKYNRATENLVTPNFRDADQKYLYMKNALKGASLGASGYLANLQQAHVNNVLNKAQIQQAADNTNAGIKNQVSQYNTDIAKEEILANAKIRANARNIKQSAIASIGSNSDNQMNDVRNTEMDKKKMDGLIKMYPSLSKDPKMLEYFMSFNA